MTDINEEGRCFYILDARSVVGNCAVWWRPNAQGYTCNLDEAGLYTESQARSHRVTDVAVRSDVARKAAVAHVRIGHLRDAGALAEYDEGRSLQHEEHEFVEEDT